jgi:molecular chaperone DnaK
VAQGAAIQGGIIQGDVKDILLLDVTPLSLAVEVEGGIAHAMIPRNTTIPTKKSNTYTTASDNQPAVTIHVTQWERQFAKDNKSLGMFNLEGIPPMRRGQAQIEVTFDIDANGILHVSAKEKSTGKEQKVVIQWATWLSDEEIRQAQMDAEKFAEDDRKRKELVESSNKLEALIYQMETMEKDNADKIPAEEKEKITALMNEAKALKEKPDVTKEEIDKEMERFHKEFYELYQKYNAENTAANPNPDEIIEDTGATSPEAGKVIDADEK